MPSSEWQAGLCGGNEQIQARRLHGGMRPHRMCTLLMDSWRLPMTVSMTALSMPPTPPPPAPGAARGVAHGQAEDKGAEDKHRWLRSSVQVPNIAAQAAAA